MAISLLHTPEGVRDLYNEECAKKETVSAKIGAVFHRFGYRSIQTPSYEFFDIFNKDRGSVASNQMFKFFDRDGNTLVLRPDITPSIARCAAKYFMDEDMPVRLCYNGNIFINNMSLRGSLKESTVMGAEMINDTTTDADAEMVAMLIQSRQVSGLTEFQVEIGQVDFFNGLVEEAGFNEQETDELRTLIEQKNYFGVEEMLSAKDLPEQLKQALLSMPKLFEASARSMRQRLLQIMIRRSAQYIVLKSCIRFLLPTDWKTILLLILVCLANFSIIQESFSRHIHMEAEHLLQREAVMTSCFPSSERTHHLSALVFM